MTREQRPVTTRSLKMGVAGLVTGGLLVVVAIAILVHLWVTLGDRGIYADATGTAGFSTQSELISGGAAVLGLLVGTIIVIISVVSLGTRTHDN